MKKNKKFETPLTHTEATCSHIVHRFGTVELRTANPVQCSVGRGEQLGLRSGTS